MTAIVNAVSIPLSPPKCILQWVEWIEFTNIADLQIFLGIRVHYICRTTNFSNALLGYKIEKFSNSKSLVCSINTLEKFIIYYFLHNAYLDNTPRINALWFKSFENLNPDSRRLGEASW